MLWYVWEKGCVCNGRGQVRKLRSQRNGATHLCFTLRMEKDLQVLVSFCCCIRKEGASQPCGREACVGWQWQEQGFLDFVSFIPSTMPLIVERKDLDFV